MTIIQLRVHWAGTRRSPAPSLVPALRRLAIATITTSAIFAALVLLLAP